jgi:hypothetical protein
MNPFKDIVYRQGKDGRIFILHWKYKFDPVSIALIGGAALGAGGQIYSGMGAAAEGKSAQNMANYNAQLAEREAKMTEQKTLIEQRQQMGEAERRRSTMQANMGAEGVVSTTGTPLLIQAQQAEQDELQNLMIGFSGAEESRSLRSEATLQRLQGKQAMRAGKAARTASFIGAGSTLLTGFSSAADKGLFTKKPPSPFKVGTKTQLKNQTSALTDFYGYG